MSLKPPPIKGGGDWDPCPAGMHPAVCVDVFALKNQQGFGGKKQTKLLIVFECDPASTGWREYESEGQTQQSPFTVRVRENFTMHKKGNLRGKIESWRGQPFKDDDQAVEFDFDTLIGVQCQLQVQHEDKEGGGVWDNVTVIVQAPSGQEYQSSTYVRMCDRKPEEVPDSYRGNLVFTDEEDREDDGSPF